MRTCRRSQHPPEENGKSKVDRLASYRLEYLIMAYQIWPSAPGSKYSLSESHRVIISDGLHEDTVISFIVNGRNIV
jgi:hypothetical protein